MLACPQCPLLGIFHVVSFNVILNSGNGTVFNSILHKLFTADLRSFVHCRNHNITGFFFINLRHPRSHNMHSTEYHFTFLLTSIYTRKSFFNTFNFNATLIRKDITGGPVTRIFPTNYFQSFCNCITILTAHKKVCAYIPASVSITNVQGK